MSDPQISVFLLPFSGASFYSYQPFQEVVPQGLRLLPLELPGRGRRMMEPLLYSVEAMVDDLWKQMAGQIRQPYAIYGHSLGSLLAFELVRRIQQIGAPSPLHLFVSGRAGPQVPYPEQRHLLPRRQFFDKVLELGGSSPEVFEDDEMSRFFEPILRADFQAAETYVYRQTSLLEIPIDVMIGTRERVTPEDARRWAGETCAASTLLQLEGNHFFIFPHRELILQHLSRQLKTALVRSTAEGIFE